MITGSFRTENCLEVWDLRMWGRARVIPWEGSGAFEVNDQETDEEPEDLELNEVKESEDDDAMSMHSRQKYEAGSTTTAQTPTAPKPPRQHKKETDCPYLYTV